MKTLDKTEIGQFTTIRIGGIAERVFFPSTEKEIVQLLGDIISKKETWALIGGGSNLLASSENFPGNIIVTTGLNSIEQIENNLLLCGAGVRLPRLSAYAAKLCLSGLEFCEGIPGTVGGGVIMNAGAHGSSTNKILESVNVLDLKEGKIKTLKNEDISFGYRMSSINPKEQIITSAIFKLESDSESSIRMRMKENNTSRQKNQPLKDPSAGCTFKNPIELNMSTGKILDSLGVKNMTIGSAQVSNMHANFLINIGNATSHDVCKLMIKLQNLVQEKFKILLKPEIKPLGVFTEEELLIWKDSVDSLKNSFIITR